MGVKIRGGVRRLRRFIIYILFVYISLYLLTFSLLNLPQNAMQKLLAKYEDWSTR